MRSSRRIVTAATQVVLILACAELTSLFYARVRLGEDYSTIAASKDEVLRTIPRSGAGDDDPAASSALNLARTLHPYFGYTYRRGASATDPINNQGFLERVDFPYAAADGEFVVGVFGGSVAELLRLEQPRAVLERRLLEPLASKGYRSVRLLMMAQGGWREPQPLFCFLYFIDSIDAAIFLDGFNEIAQIPLAKDYKAQYPWTFPAPQIYARLAAAGTQLESALARQRIGALRRQQLRFTRIAAGGVLGRSMLAHMIWRSYMTLLERKVERLDDEGAADAGAGYAAMVPRARDFDAALDSYFSEYESWIEMAHDVGLSRHKPVFHFIQPNQYVEGSKPFSDRELKIALNRPSFRERVHAYYPRLSRASERLRDEGVGSFDLSMVFSTTHDTVYVDSCCHPNVMGMTAVAEQIARDITSSSQLQMVAAAGAR